MEAGVRSLSLADLDEGGLRALIAQGEPLFVERKVATPRDGLGPTVASFANTLGGWLLLGIADQGGVRGFTEHGRSDLQDHLRHKLRNEVDPLPPFLARSFELDGKTIGVVRVIESSDTPHIVRRTGALYIREPGGKQPIRDHQTLMSLARRGAEARDEAAKRLRELPMIGEALRTPERLPDDRIWTSPPEPGDRPPLPPVLEMIVVAAPLTVSPAFADRALAESTVTWSSETVKRLWERALDQLGPHRGEIEVYQRGFAIEGVQRGSQRLVTLAVDSGGVVAARTAQRRQGGTFLLDTLANKNLPVLLEVVADTLAYLDAHGRALVDLVVRGIHGMQVQGGSNEVVHSDKEKLHIGGELPIPAEPRDFHDFAGRWAREFGRATGLPHWEPGRSQASDGGTAKESDATG